MRTTRSRVGADADSQVRTDSRVKRPLEKKGKLENRLVSSAGATASRIESSMTDPSGTSGALSVTQNKASFFHVRGLALIDAQKSWKKHLPFFYIKTSTGAYLPCQRLGKELSHNADLVGAAFRPGSTLLATIDEAFPREIVIAQHEDLQTGKFPHPVMLHILTQSFHQERAADCLRVFLLEMKETVSANRDERSFQKYLLKGMSAARQREAADRCVCYCASTASAPFLRKLLQRWRNPEAIAPQGTGDYFFALTIAVQEMQIAEAKLLRKYGARVDFPVHDEDRYITPAKRLTWELESKEPGYKKMRELLNSLV